MVLDWMCYVGCCSQSMRSNEEDLCQVHWSLAEVFSPVKRVLEYGWKLDFNKTTHIWCSVWAILSLPPQSCFVCNTQHDQLNLWVGWWLLIIWAYLSHTVWSQLQPVICFTGLRRFEHGQRDSAARVQGLVEWWGWKRQDWQLGGATCEANNKNRRGLFLNGAYPWDLLI